MTYQRDLKKLLLSLNSLTNGQGSVTVDEENICKFTLTIIPNDGLYHNGKFDFEISFDDPSSYPEDLPQVICTTPIYHPNIDSDELYETNVCLSLFDEWDSNSLADIVQGLLFLFYNPNIEDPLSSLFNGTETQDEFAENVRLSLKGELIIDGMSFERNQVTDGVCTITEDTDTSCGANNTQETIDTPRANINDTEQSTENSSNDILSQEINELSDPNEHETDDFVSNLTDKATDLDLVKNQHDLVKIFVKQDSVCTTVSSEPSISTATSKVNQNDQIWNMVLVTLTMFFTYMSYVNCDQHLYETLR